MVMKMKQLILQVGNDDNILKTNSTMELQGQGQTAS